MRPRRQEETAAVDALLGNAAAAVAPADHRERYVHRRGFAGDLPGILEFEVEFRLHLDSLTASVHAGLISWQSKAMQATAKSRPGTTPAKPPANSPGGDESEESASGSGEGTEVA